ncbi:MAG: flagellar biosynthesis protein FlhA [Planctomycetota bacterium]|nr:flagellar biosynthesis protein FlhA [Planctomycetota bacterium]
MSEPKMKTLRAPSDWKGTIARNRDLALVLALAGMLIAILVPLPGPLMDGLLGANLGFSVLVLLTVVYLRKPLEFASFPSLLLLATLYRLALNIATTRLVLSRAGEEGVGAAGDVVLFFGEFVSGANPVVGFIIFAILVVIQFVVVTKGASRIAEVSARFTLDRMPGAQMAIDADLNAGNITGDQASTARVELAEQADFYGAMDGASKFVRGDAIAGIIITMINIVGGFAIGVLQYNMTLAEAGRVFTTLTIGDGLVTQIPALFISVAAGLMVTRASSRGQIGDAVVGQLFGNPKALAVTAVILLGLTFTGLPPVVLGLLALSLGAIAWFTSQVKGQEDGQAERQENGTDPSAGASVEELEAAAKKQMVQQKPDARAHEFSLRQPISIVLGYGLHDLMAPQGKGIPLQVRVQQLREELQKQLGFWIPPVHARIEMREIPRQEFQIFLRENPCARGVVRAKKSLVLGDHHHPIDTIAGEAVPPESYGAPARWISTEDGEMLQKARGYKVLSAQDALLFQLRKVVIQHIEELLTQRETRKILDRLGDEFRPLIEEVVPGRLRVGEVQKVLQSLVAEQVSIRDMEKILETLSEAVQQQSGEIQSLDPLVELVRVALRRNICSGLVDTSGTLHAVTLDPEIESLILAALDSKAPRGAGPCLSPEVHDQVVGALKAALEAQVEEGHPALLLTSAPLRIAVKKLMEKEVPMAAVLSYNEVAHGVTVESWGMAGIEARGWGVSG